MRRSGTGCATVPEDSLVPRAPTDLEAPGTGEPGEATPGRNRPANLVAAATYNRRRE
jgi:hypothetical protein